MSFADVEEMRVEIEPDGLGLTCESTSVAGTATQPSVGCTNTARWIVRLRDGDGEQHEEWRACDGCVIRVASGRVREIEGRWQP